MKMTEEQRRQEDIQLRQIALSEAARVLGDMPSQKIVERAEQYYAFLKGDTQAK
jgi:hypothetical protein